MMSSLLQEVLALIEKRNPLHNKKLRESQLRFDQRYFSDAEAFFENYNKVLVNEGKDLSYAVDCYLKMLDDFMYAQIEFYKTGRYLNTSFDAVNESFYNNPNANEYYMHGLLLSQFLWFHHYNMFAFFRSNISRYNSLSHRYLEIGGGHGLYMKEAEVQLSKFNQFHLVDISPTSIDLSKKFNASNNVDYFNTNIFDYNPKMKYNFVSMCEVLEHVENPLELLEKLKGLLSNEGMAFVTTPTNAPTIDHIYLFNHIDEIREIINQTGFVIEKELGIPSENISIEKANKNKVCVMYGAFIKINHNR